MIMRIHMVANSAHWDTFVLQHAILPHLIRTRQAARLATLVAYFSRARPTLRSVLYDDNHHFLHLKS